MRKIFVCTDIEKAKQLGFINESGNQTLTYYYGITRGIRIHLDKEYYLMSFIHYSHEVLSVFKKMVELGIVKEMKIPYYKKDSEINKLRRRIVELEEELKNVK